VKKPVRTAALLSSVLLLTLAIALLDKCSAANLSVSVEVTSPENGGIYDSTNVTLKFAVFMSIDINYGSYYIDSVQYRVDNNVYKKAWGDFPSSSSYGLFSLSYDLVGLSEGRHLLEVTVRAVGGWLGKTVSSGIIYFTVDTTAPKVQFVSTQQQTFGSGDDALFNFTCFEASGVSWLGYSLDGGGVVTVTDNVSSSIVSRSVYDYQLTLPGLADGAHSLTVYTEDLVGNTGESEAFHFTVGQETQPEPEQPSTEQPFSTALIAIASVSVVAVSVLASILL